jgi:division/cell wall cluster transcriptional repressor MraZ
VFQGATELSLDAKGRLTVPTRYRDALLSGGRAVVLTAHPDSCLLLYPKVAWELIGAKVQATTFRAVNLTRATFRNAVLLRSSFVDYLKSTATLVRVEFVEAVLIEVDLREVNLYEADLSRALLIRCDLRAAIFAGANLTGARLIDCRTEGTDLSGATV